MKLEYQITTSGLAQLRSVLRGVEREYRATNQRMAQDQTRSFQKSAKATQQYAPGRKEQLAQLKAQERAAIASDRARHRAVLANLREEERQRLRAVMRSAREEQRQVVQAHRQALAQQRDQAKRSLALSSARADFWKSTGRGASGVVGRAAGGTLGGVAKLGGGAVALAGGFAIADALQQQSAIGRTASEIANAAGNPALKGELAREAGQVKGFTGTETLAAMQEFITKTGDLGAARAMIQDMGQLALATATDFGELGGAAGQAFNVIRDTVTDPKEQIKQLNDVMRTLAAQGNLGAVEIKDMVTELAGLGAATRKFQGGPSELIKTMGAMAQASVARGGSSSAAEATTAVSRFTTDIIQNQGKFTAAGVNVFADKNRTKLKDPTEIMADVLEKTGGDLTKVTDLFGVYAERAVGGFSPLFVEAEKKQKGSGRAAVMAEFDKFRKATVTQAQLQERANSRLQDFDLQMKEATKSVTTALGNEMAPVVLRLATGVRDLSPLIASGARHFAAFATALADNPMTGIGAIFGAMLVKEMASAGIGPLIASALQGELGKIGTYLGAGGIAIAAITASIAVATMYIETLEQKAKADVADATKRGEEIRAKATREFEEQGFISQETRNELEGLQNTEQKTLKEGSDATQEGWLGYFRRGFNSLTGGEDDLNKGMHVMQAAGDASYNDGARQTQVLLEMDKIFKETGFSWKKQIEDAGEAMKKKIESAQPGRNPRTDPILGKS